MRRCLLRRQSERFSPGVKGLSKALAKCRIKRRFLRHLRTHCGTRCNSLTAKIVRLLSESLLRVEQSQGKEQPGDATLVVESSKEGETLLHQSTGGGKIAASPGSRAKTIERERNAPPVPKLPEQS